MIINNDIENLDIRSMDPFVASDPRNQWSPTNIARILDENVFSDISKLMQLNTTLKIYFNLFYSI